MENIEQSIDRILKLALQLLAEIRKKPAQEEGMQEMYLMVSEIIRTCHQIQNFDKEALRRIGVDLEALFGDIEKARGALRRVGVDTKAIFGK